MKLITLLFLPLSLFAQQAYQQVSFEWGKNPTYENIVGYRLYYSTSSQSYGDTFVDVLNGTNGSIYDLMPETTYYAVVTAINEYGESGYSNEVEFTTGPYSEVPSTPINLQIGVVLNITSTVTTN